MELRTQRDHPVGDSDGVCSKRTELFSGPMTPLVLAILLAPLIGSSQFELASSSYDLMVKGGAAAAAALIEEHPAAHPWDVAWHMERAQREQQRERR